MHPQAEQLQCLSDGTCCSCIRTELSSSSLIFLSLPAAMMVRMSGVTATPLEAGSARHHACSTGQLDADDSIHTHAWQSSSMQTSQHACVEGMR